MNAPFDDVTPPDAPIPVRAVLSELREIKRMVGDTNRRMEKLEKRGLAPILLVCVALLIASLAYRKAQVVEDRVEDFVPAGLAR